MQQLQIFLAFFRVGMLGYGGGPSSIPLVHKEVVEKYEWINDDDFADILALGNTLPGPIATKMAGYIGYRVAGLLGMINAVLATIVPTILLMIILLTSLSAFKDQPWVAGMSRGVIPVVGMMLIVLTWDFFKKAKDGLGWTWALVLMVGSYVLLELLGVHPAFIIFGLLLAALLKSDKKQSGSKEATNKGGQSK